MKSIDAKKSLEYKIAGSRKLPNDDELSEMFFEAMLYISNKCVPNELVRFGESEDKVYRTIENSFFICYPDKPNFDDDLEHLMIDESLTYAVINYVAFLITKEMAYMQIANELIGDFVANDGKDMAEWMS